MNTAVKAPPQIKLTPCDSSQIHAHGHCADTNTLALQFKGKGGVPGSIYHYAHFTADDYAAFTRAESKGTHFGAHIKKAKHADDSPKFPHTKIADAPHAANRHS